MLTGDLVSKITEQIERTDHLVRLVPEAQTSWRPPIAGAWTVAELLGHLLDCLAGFCAVLHKALPDDSANLAGLRRLPVNHACSPAEACERLALYRVHIERGFALLNDQDLGRKLPTVFVPEGETLLTLFLGNLEHLINHKHQLFVYLKLMGLDIGTPDLYRLRG